MNLVIPSVPAQADDHYVADTMSARYYQHLARQSLAPLWVSLSRLVPAEPTPTAHPFALSFANVLPSLLEAGKLTPRLFRRLALAI